MRVLFDQGTPAPLRDSLTGHSVETTYERGWSTLSNGDLLKAAEDASFDSTVEAEDTYFGKTYKDPYRWLENLKDKEVETWFKAQAEVTDGLVGKIPGREASWEPGKFVAAMQNATASGHPVLMKVNYDNGHFTEEKIVTFRSFAGQSAFLLWQTGHKDFQPAKEATKLD